MNQSAPNFVKWYRAIISRVSSIMGVIRQNNLSYLPLNLKNWYISLCLHCSIYKYQPVSSKVGQNIYDSLRSQIGLIKGVIGPEQVELFALELESLLE